MNNYIDKNEALKRENRVAIAYYILFWFLMIINHLILYSYVFYYNRRESSFRTPASGFIEKFTKTTALLNSVFCEDIGKIFIIVIINFLILLVLYLLIRFFSDILARRYNFEGLMAKVLKIGFFIILCLIYVFITPFILSFFDNSMYPDFASFVTSSYKNLVVTVTFTLINILIIIILIYIPIYIIYRGSFSDKQEHINRRIKYRLVYWHYYLKSRLVDAPYSFGIGSLLLFISSLIVIVTGHKNFPISIMFFVISAFVLILSDILTSFTKIYKTLEEYTVYIIKEKLILTQKFSTIIIGFGNLGRQIAYNELKRDMEASNSGNRLIDNLIKWFKFNIYYVLIIDNDFELRLIPKHLLFIENKEVKYDEIYKDRINRISIGILRGEVLNTFESSYDKNPEDVYSVNNTEILQGEIQVDQTDEINNQIINDNLKSKFNCFDTVSLASICFDAQSLGIWKLLNYSANPMILVTAFDIQVAKKIDSYFQKKLIINDPKPIILALTNTLIKRMYFKLDPNTFIHPIDDTEYETSEAALIALRKCEEKSIRSVLIWGPIEWAITFRNKFVTYKAQLYDDSIELSFIYQASVSPFEEFKQDESNLFYKRKVSDKFSVTELFADNSDYEHTIPSSMDQLQDGGSKLFIFAIRPFSKVVFQLQTLLLRTDYKIKSSAHFLLCANDTYKGEIQFLQRSFFGKNEKENRLLYIESNNITANMFNAISDNKPHISNKLSNTTESYYLNILINNDPLALCKTIFKLQKVCFRRPAIINKYIPSFFQSYSFAGNIYGDNKDTFIFKADFILIQNKSEYWETKSIVSEGYVKPFYPSNDSSAKVADFFFNNNSNKNTILDRTFTIKLKQDADEVNSKYALSYFHSKNEKDVNSRNIIIGSQGTIKMLCKSNSNPIAFSQALSVLYGIDLKETDIESTEEVYNIVFEYGSVCNDQGHFIQEFFLEPSIIKNRKLDNKIVQAFEISFHKKNSDDSINSFLETLKCRFNDKGIIERESTDFKYGLNFYINKNMKANAEQAFNRIV